MTSFNAGSQHMHAHVAFTAKASAKGPWVARRVVGDWYGAWGLKFVEVAY